MIGSRSGLDVRGPAPGQPTRCLLFCDTSPHAVALKPSLAIEVGADTISVINPDTHAATASAPLAQVTAIPANYRRDPAMVLGHRSRSEQFPTTIAVLVVRVPGAQSLSIGCPDGRGVIGPRVVYRSFSLVYRFSWRSAVPKEKQPAYWLSGADWLTLVEKFGLAPQLEDSARR